MTVQIGCGIAPADRKRAATSSETWRPINPDDIRTHPDGLRRRIGT